MLIRRRRILLDAQRQVVHSDPLAAPVAGIGERQRHRVEHIRVVSVRCHPQVLPVLQQRFRQVRQPPLLGEPQEQVVVFRCY